MLPLPGGPSCGVPGPWPSSSFPSSPPAAAAAPPRRPRPRRHRAGDHPGGSAGPHLHLRRRLDAGPPGRHPGQREGQRLHRGASCARLGLTPAGDSGGFLQRVPLAELRPRRRRGPRSAPGRAPWPPFADYYPYQPTSRFRSARSTARRWSTSAGWRTRPRIRPRRAPGEGGGVPQRVRRQLDRRARTWAHRGVWAWSPGSWSPRSTRSSPLRRYLRTPSLELQDSDQSRRASPSPG